MVLKNRFLVLSSDELPGNSENALLSPRSVKNGTHTVMNCTKQPFFYTQDICAVLNQHFVSFHYLAQILYIVLRTNLRQCKLIVKFGDTATYLIAPR